MSDYSWSRALAVVCVIALMASAVTSILVHFFKQARNRRRHNRRRSSYFRNITSDYYRVRKWPRGHQ